MWFSSYNQQVMNASKVVIPSWRLINPHFFLCLHKFLYNSDQNAAKFLFLVKTEIFYEFSKWRKIEIRKPITKPRNLPKGNGSSVMWPLKSTWLFRLNTKRSYKRQGHATFKALCWLFCAMVESRNNSWLTKKSRRNSFFSVKIAEWFS